MILNKEQVGQAIKALKDIYLKHHETKKKSLIDEGKILLQITMKRIPDSKSIQMIKVPLPHSFLSDSAEVCLILGDRDKKNHKAEIEPDIIHYKELLAQKGVTKISEVMTLRQLRTEYKPYEAKQKLLGAFDVFLADNRISECLPKILGRHFFRKRKFPIQIEMRSINFKDHVHKILSSSILYVTGHGNSCTCEIANMDMTESEVADNVMSISNVISKDFPGSWENVSGIYLKAAKSPAIPIYLSYG